MDVIKIKGAREHNLKNISLEIPRGKLVVFTGVSGSGKSSLAFDTIFAEGQRRYVESLSAYARQFLAKMDKPDVDEIEGLSPAISIDQKTTSHNPRSTVATATEIYDYLRVLYARVGVPYCVNCGTKIQKLTVQEIMALIEERIAKRGQALLTRQGLASVTILAPLVRSRKGEYYQMLYDLYSKGYSEVRVDGVFHKLSDQIVLSRYKSHTIELVIDCISKVELDHASHEEKLRLQEAVEAALQRANGLVTVLYEERKGEDLSSEALAKEETFSSSFACPHDGFSFPEIEPRLFSFNSPQGACPACHGIGLQDFFSETPCAVCKGMRLRPEVLAIKVGDKNIADACALTIDEALIFFAGRTGPGLVTAQQGQALSLHGAAAKIAEPVLKEIINRLTFLQEVGLTYLALERKMGTLSGGEAQRIRLASQLGSRLTGTLYVLDEPTIGLHPADNDKLLATLLELRDLQNTVIVVEHDRATIEFSDFLVDIGPLAGKHGGEVVAIGETRKLIENAKVQSSNVKSSLSLRDISRRETKSKVSKKESVIPAKAGIQARTNLDPDVRWDDGKSLTLDYLIGKREIPVPSDRRVNTREHLKIISAHVNNLKHITLEIPLRRFVCLTGVSGSGKSTLLYDVLHKGLEHKLYGVQAQPTTHKDIFGSEYVGRVLTIDQSPIGRTPRSNPATYVGFWAHIRDLFAMTEEARKRGYGASRFSFNVSSISKGGKGGRCEACQGYGYQQVEMHFLPTVWVSCDICNGKRFDAETMEVLYKGKNIYEILKMTIAEAREFFSDVYYIADKLKVLEEVGLGYLEIGQTAPTLSGGEAQRIKLGAELASPARARTLYLFDEPTVGLHFEDVRKLMEILQRLVSTGNTVMVIEHNLDVIKCADYIIDLGPGGGKHGGRVVAMGTPEEVMKNKDSLTGKYLKSVLK